MFIVYDQIKERPPMYACKPEKLTIPVLIAVLGSPFLMPMTGDPGYTARIILNLMHIPAFAVIAVLFLQFYRDYIRSSPYWLIYSISILVIFGVATELVQAFIPGRWASAQDVLLNLVGISFGTSLFLMLNKFRPGLVSGIVCKSKTAAQSNAKV